MRMNAANNGYLVRMRWQGAFRSTILALLAIGIWQCESAIELDYSGFESKLVINAQMSADHRFEISVRTSTTPTAKGDGFVPEGLSLTLIDLSTKQEISLYRENDLFVTGPEIYAKPGVEYYVHARAPGYGSVEAYTSVPSNIEVNDLTVKDFLLEKSDVTPDKSNVSYSLELDLKTDASEYLHIIFTQHSRFVSGSLNNPVYENYTYEILPQFPEESGFVRHIEEGILISIDDIKANPISFEFQDYTIDAVNEELGIVEVEVRTVSPEYYYYFVSVMRQRVTLQDPFAEPVPIYTNIDGGLGNFSSFSSVIYEVSLF